MTRSGLSGRNTLNNETIHIRVKLMSKIYQGFSDSRQNIIFFEYLIFGVKFLVSFTRFLFVALGSTSGFGDILIRTTRLRITFPVKLDENKY